MAAQTAEKEMTKEKRISFAHSVTGRVAFTSLIAVAVLLTVILLSIIPRAESSISHTTKNYLSDMALSYGREIEAFEQQNGADALSTDNLSSILEGVGVEGMDSSYAYLVAADGTMMYHPTAEKIGQPVENSVVLGLIDQIKKGETPKPQNTTVEYMFNGDKKYAAYYVASDNSFILVISADYDEVIKPVHTMTVSGIVIGVIAAAVVFIILLATLIRLLKPVQVMTGLIDRMSNLDFSESEDEKALINSKNEFGFMARALMNMQRKIGDKIEQIKDQSTKLFDSSNGMLKHATDMNETTNQVDTAVSEIAQGATNQASETQSASENVIRIGNMIEETNTQVESLNSTASSMLASQQTATDILDELGKTNENTKNSIDEIAEETKTTNESAGRIREATNLITSIAEETNLLSLNASIEAARAGEAGRGFAVVASQIQKLAEQSNNSAQQIEDIVDDLIKNSNQTVETMEKVKEVIDKQTQDVDRTRDAFQQVSTGIEDSINGIQAISEKMKDMDVARTKVVETVSNLSAIAEENAASTEESSASVSSITGIADEIQTSSSDLRQIAEELDENMSEFKY